MTRRVFFATIVALLLVLFAGERPARAQEMCPGCFGKGKIGCGRCLSVGVGAFIGVCHTCGGFYGQSPPAGQVCQSCRGTRVCSGCDGKGMACLVCKGKGTVPKGTNAAIAADRAKKQAAGIDQHVKKRLHFLVGRWKGEGEDSEQGKYSTEMRWTSVQDDTFLRHEERIKYANGAVQEYVSYLTWSEPDQQYVWIVLFAPGRGLQIRGTPGADGSTIAWEIVLDNGAVLKLNWKLRPEKHLDIANLITSGEESKELGTCKLERTAAEPGAPLVTGGSNKKEGDEATDAVLEGMKPLKFLLGKWTGTGKNDRGALKSTGKWTALLGGTVYETDSTTTYADGSKNRTLATLTWDPKEKKAVIVTFASGGGINMLKGTVDATDEGVKVKIDINGANLVWDVPTNGDKIEWYVDVPTDGEERKVVEKGTDTKE